MSNAERQARYKQRLKEAAARGVTPEDVVAATKIVYEAIRADEGDVTRMSPWDEFLAECRQKPRSDHWARAVPYESEPDVWDWLEGEDRDLVERVAAVINASRVPPKS